MRFGSAKMVLWLLGLACASSSLGCRRGADDGAASAAEHGEPADAAGGGPHGGQGPKDQANAAHEGHEEADAVGHGAPAEGEGAHAEEAKADSPPEATDSAAEPGATGDTAPVATAGVPATGGPGAQGPGAEDSLADAAAADAEGSPAGHPEAGGDEGPDAKSSTGTASAKDLLKEVTRSKTSDARALEALAQAEAAGAKPKETAKAAYDRGKTLHATPERAAAFFEWAANKDPKYPEPVFALAQQSAVTGDVDITIERLKEVKVRRGDRLLQQIEFDPMWEIVRDDPAIRALF